MIESASGVESAGGPVPSFRTIFEHAPVGLALADTGTGKLEEVNHQLCLLTGYNHEELCSRTLFELLQPEDREPLGKELQRLVRGETRESSLQTKCVFKGERPSWAVLAVSPLDAGRAAAVVAFHDVSERVATEEKLRRNEERYRLGAYAASDALWDWDFDTQQLVWNESLGVLFGYTLETSETQFSWWVERLHPDDRERVSRGLESAIASGHLEWSDEYRFRRADGSYARVRDRGFVLCGPAGRPVRMVGAMVDVSKQRRAEAETASRLEHFRQLVEAVPTVVWTSTPEGEVNYLNRRWTELTGMTTEASLGRGWTQALHPDDRQGCSGRWNEARLHQQPYEVEVRCRTKSGDYRWMLARAVPLFDAEGRLVLWFGVYTDIQERKCAEMTVVEALRTKDDFLAMLAHELRGPLSTIVYALDAIRVFYPPDQGFYDARNAIEEKVQHMSRLLDDLLDLSRITRGKIEIKKIRLDLSTVLVKAVASIRPQASARRLEILSKVPEEPLHLEADPTRLEQVISNLLGNAVKYTPPGGRIVATLVREGAWAKLRIQDNGVGIAAELLPRIFELFVQGDPAARRSGQGLGVGLALVKRLVDLHGGKVLAHSEGVGKGSEFAVLLPFDAGRAPAGELPPEPRGAGLIQRVLVVEDDVQAAALLARMLAHSGYQVREVHDGESALREATSYQPHIVFLDITLPGIDGFEVARRIRREPFGCGSVLVALTGYGQPEDRQRSREAGFNHHLVKPVSFRMIQNLLASVQPR